jgi:hypothetical protein
MNNWLTACAMGVALATGVSGPALAQRGRDPQHPRWFSDYQMARAEARKTNRPMFLVFRCVP